MEPKPFIDYYLHGHLHGYFSKHGTRVNNVNGESPSTSMKVFSHYKNGGNSVTWAGGRHPSSSSSWYLVHLTGMIHADSVLGTIVPMSPQSGE
ncbi:hypothetical protein P7K49_016730 [Saguinus oedipus]|uniref:Uncharacterized protein n=1 Tax=Saguinus oedipus TaxID=9490 RepID=A0ABQ9VCV5_SAGOE|nr:hypothetical protein P7K49_016730 [Saguinus oedipus]